MGFPRYPRLTFQGKASLLLFLMSVHAMRRISCFRSQSLSLRRCVLALPSDIKGKHGVWIRRTLGSLATVEQGLTNLDNATKSNSSLRLMVPSAEDMEEVGAVLSSVLLEEQPLPRGVVILLDGDLGVGKTSLARGFVRASTGDWGLRVTSPTFLLSNTYRVRTGESLEVHHIDLYRLSGRPEDLVPLNLAHVFRSCFALVEWPSRLVNAAPDDRLEIHIKISDDEVDGDEERKPRLLTMEPRGDAWEARIRRIRDDGLVDDMIT